MFGFGIVEIEGESGKGEEFGRLFIKGCGAWFIGLGLIRFSMEASGSVGPTATNLLFFLIFKIFQFWFFCVQLQCDGPATNMKNQNSRSQYIHSLICLWYKKWFIVKIL